MENQEHQKAPTVPQLDAQRFQLAEHERNVFICTIEGGVTRKNILDPAFWAHVANKLRPYTEIILRCDDGTLYARVLVTQAERTWARVHVLEWHDLTTKDVALSKAEPIASPKMPETNARYQVVQKGPHLKWCVIDNETNPPTLVREKEPTKVQATAWLEEYLRVTT